MAHHSLIRDPAVECETRYDRPYDEQHPGHVVHWNGSLIGSLDRQFLGGAARLIFDHHLDVYERSLALAMAPLPLTVLVP